MDVREYGITVTIRPGPGQRPCRAAIDSPGVTAARAAMERAFGTAVLFSSIPAATRKG
jgi:hypothetical protein